MVKLTPFGKLIMGVVGLLILAVIYMVALKPPPVPQECQENPSSCDITVPAYTKPFQYPFKNADQRAQFRDRSKSPSDYCSFFSSYTANRGVPITFRAYVPPTARQSPYYYADPKTGREFLPAYFVAPNGRGVMDAFAFADEDVENLPPCASGTNGVILLGFGKGQRPVSPLVEVDGIIWWDSLFLNPAQTETQAGLETTAAPVVLVGASDGVAPSQATHPATETRVLNTAVGRGPAVIRVGRIEFADTQTRVWIELVNKGNRPLEPWPGVSMATLREEGGPSLPAGSGLGEQEEFDVGEGNPTLNDQLPDEPVPSKGGGTLKGYLVFPRVDSSKRLYLSLTDFNIPSSDAHFPVVLRLDPPSNG